MTIGTTLILICNFPFLDVVVPRAMPYGVYSSQLIVPLEHEVFNIQNKILTAKLLKQAYRNHNYAKHFLILSQSF